MSTKLAKKKTVSGKKLNSGKQTVDKKAKKNTSKTAAKNSLISKSSGKNSSGKMNDVKKAAVKKTSGKNIPLKKSDLKKQSGKKAAANKISTVKSSFKKAVSKKSVSTKKKEITKTVKKVIAKSKAGLKFRGKSDKNLQIKKPVIKNNIPEEIKPVKLKKYKPNKKVKYNTSELKHFRNIILLERKAILESAKANMDSLVDKDSGEYKGDNLTYSSHMAEQGTDEMEREKNYLFVQRDEKYLGYLQDALMRIDQGTYGICVDCIDEPKNLCRTCPLIDGERLELVPITQHCIECKNMRG